MSDQKPARKSRPPRQSGPKPKGAGPSGRARRASAPKAEARERPAKPDTSGGIKIMLRNPDHPHGAVTTEQLTEQLLEAARQTKDYPPGTMFKWATIYMTPIDPDGNKIALEGVRKNQTIAPYKSAADELKA